MLLSPNYGKAGVYVCFSTGKTCKGSGQTAEVCSIAYVFRWFFMGAYNLGGSGLKQLGTN